MGVQLKLPEVARRLGVSEKTARRYVKSGALPSMFVGNAYRVSEEDVERFLQDSRVTAGGDSGKAQAPLPLDFEVVGPESVSQLDPSLWRGYCDYLAEVFENFAEREAPHEQVIGWAEAVSHIASYVVGLIGVLDDMVKRGVFTDQDHEMVPLLRATYRMAVQGDRVIRRALEEPDQEIEARFWEIVEGMHLTNDQREAITA